MSYQKFEKNGIEYTLFLGMHVRSSYPMIEESGGLESLDVLVLENSGFRIDERYNLLEFLHFRQYQEIFQKIPEKNPELKVYLCDVALTEFGRFIESAKYFLTFPIASPLILGRMINSSSSKKEKGVSAKIKTLYDLILPTPFESLRVALTARSIEEHIIPKETIEGRKLRVGILYGGFHTGIKTQIKHRKLRNAIIGMYKLLGYPGIDSENYHITRATNCSPFNATIEVEEVEL